MIKSVPVAREPELLKQTTSICPACKQACPGEVWKTGDTPPRVLLKRTCPEHGEQTACIASDARFYWLAKGDPANRCCGGACCSADGESNGTLGRNAQGRGREKFEVLSTCLALIEIVDSCNLQCPVCFADAPEGVQDHLKAVPLEALQARIQGVIDRKGKIEILQLSGGEPTLHPKFFELLRWAQEHPHIDYTVINTNGLLLATDDAFAAHLAEAAKRHKLQLYLQFDGPQEAGQQFLRGADLRRIRETALDRCEAMKLPVTLAMTVTPENLPYIWASIEFGLGRPHVHGITFQPMFTSGRVPGKVAATIGGAAGERLNVADILLSAIEGSEGLLKAGDFTPLPCGDPNCAIIGYLIRSEGGFHSVADFMDLAKLQGFLQDKVRYTLDDLAKCGCETEPLGHVLKQIEVGPNHPFRIMVKPFMDAWSWDQDRIDRCCTHVIRPDGKLDSFCRYYAAFPAMKSAP